MTRPRLPLRAAALPAAAVLGAVLLGACAAPDPAPSQRSTTVAAEPLPSGSSGSAPTASARVVDEDLTGTTIAIDPGHNGGNAKDPAAIASPVPDGRGGEKACNTTGTATDSDYSEAEFAWEVSGLLAADLEAAGAEVVLSRDDNDGVGPCVDERGTFAADADALVSIHANGSESTSAKGFHVIVADPGTTPELETASTELAEAISAALAGPFTPNPAYGKEAISPRPDLAGLNNASVPAVIVECGEMRNPEEAKAMESADGRKEYAEAIARGVADWLG